MTILSTAVQYMTPGRLEPATAQVGYSCHMPLATKESQYMNGSKVKENKRHLSRNGDDNNIKKYYKI